MKLKFKLAKYLYVRCRAPINVNYATSTTAMATATATTNDKQQWQTAMANCDGNGNRYGNGNTNTNTKIDTNGKWRPANARYGNAVGACTHACICLSPLRSHALWLGTILKVRAQRLLEISGYKTHCKWLLNAPICCRHRPQSQVQSPRRLIKCVTAPTYA